VINFDGAEGTMIGAPNKGLNAMFIMMNTARLAVGLQGLALIERAYQNSLAYAKDRLQSRSLTGAKRPDKPADPLLVHPDIRRMLLTQKAFAEGGRALAYYACVLVDIVDKSPDADEKKRADELLSFLTPIVKGVLTEAGVECTYHALQIFGGHGYIKEWGMEQFARDARITTIYEGTTQIQALDLLGRKTLQGGAGGLKQFLGEIGAFCAAHATNEQLAEFTATLTQLAQEWSELTREVGSAAMANADEAGAAAYDYLFYAGYIAIAYFWAREIAALQSPASKQSADFRAAKLSTAASVRLITSTETLWFTA